MNVSIIFEVPCISYRDLGSYFINPVNKSWETLHPYNIWSSHTGIWQESPSFMPYIVPYIKKNLLLCLCSVTFVFYISPAHSWFCRRFIFLMILQRQTFPIIFSSWLLLLQKKATAFLMFTSYLMILLNSHQFQCFLADSHRFFKKIFPENAIFFLFSNQQRSYPSFLFWFSLYWL